MHEMFLKQPPKVNQQIGLSMFFFPPEKEDHLSLCACVALQFSAINIPEFSCLSLLLLRLLKFQVPFMLPS